MSAHLATATLDTLLDASIAGGLAIAIAWLICRSGRLHPHWQALIWWAASLKLLATLAGVPAIPLAVLPATPTPTGEAATHSTPAPWAGPAGTSRAATTHVRMVPTPASSDTAAPRQPLSAGSKASLILAALWLLGIAVAGTRLLLSHRHLHRLMRRAIPVDDDVAALARQAASRAGVRRVPPAWMSEDIQTPQTIGALRPAILLPAAALNVWTRDELRMALCHEMAHVRRRDLLWGWVPLVARSLFFFHPLARMAAREYLVAREAACDAEALETANASPDEYGRLLVRLGIDTRGCALTAGGASGSRSVLARRLDMLVRSPRRLSRPGQLALAVIAVLVLLPLELSARQTEAPRPVTSAPSVQTQAARPVTVAPATASRAARPVDVVPVAPTRPARPVARAVPQTPAPAQTESSSPAPSLAPRPVEPAQSDAAALQKELEAARRAAAEREREATDAARDMRVLERALQAERARAQLREQMGLVQQRLGLSLAQQDRQQRRLTQQELEQRPLAQQELEQRRLAIQEMAMQLEALRARLQVAEASPDDRMRLLREQVQLLVAQQQSLLDEQQALAQQQQALAEAQRRLAEQLARVREALEAAQ